MDVIKIGHELLGSVYRLGLALTKEERKNFATMLYTYNVYELCQRSNKYFKK